MGKISCVILNKMVLRDEFEFQVLSNGFGIEIGITSQVYKIFKKNNDLLIATYQLTLEIHFCDKYLRNEFSR